jgi:hypothetical protein
MRAVVWNPRRAWMKRMIAIHSNATSNTRPRQ